MQYGFKNCCNPSEYFIIEDIPAYVNVGEVWYIQTTQNNDIAATYVELPSLNYSPQVFYWSVGSQFPSCDDIFDDNNINCNQTTLVTSLEIGSGAVVTTNECGCLTVIPLSVTCQSTNPTTNGGNNGVVRLNIQGGTAPYTITSGNTVLNSPQPGVFTVRNGAPEGSYSYVVNDSTGDFSTTITCILNTPPTTLNATCTTNPTTLNGSPTGSLIVSVNGGTPPYNLVFTGTTYPLASGSKTFSNLFANTYTVTITDSGTINLLGQNEQQTTSVTCNVNDATPISFPDTICLSIPYCNQTYSLSFTKQSTQYNYRPIYLSSTHASIGVTNQMTLRYETTNNKWQTSAYTQTGTWSVPSTCTPAYSVQFIQQIGNNQPTGVYTSPGSTTFQSGTKTMYEDSCPINYTLTSTPSCSLLPTPSGTVTFGTVQNGTAPYQYTLFLNGTSQGTQFTPIFNNIGAGTYKGVVEDSLGNTLTLAQAPSVSVGNNTPVTVNWVNCVAAQPITIVGNGTQSYKAILDGYFTNIPTGNQVSANLSFSISINKVTPGFISSITANYTNLKIYIGGVNVTSVLNITPTVYVGDEFNSVGSVCPKTPKEQSTVYTFQSTSPILLGPNQHIQIQVTFQYQSTNSISTNTANCYERVYYLIEGNLTGPLNIGPNQCVQFPPGYFQTTLSAVSLTKIKNQTISNTPSTLGQWTTSLGTTTCNNSIIIN